MVDLAVPLVQDPPKCFCFFCFYMGRVGFMLLWRTGMNSTMFLSMCFENIDNDVSANLGQSVSGG